MSRKSLFPFTVAVVLASSLLFSNHPACGAILKHLNLAQLWQQAETVFHGVCTKVDIEEADAVKYTFSPLCIFKGHPASSITVRMHKKASALARVPTFHPGQEVILFLYPKSPSGFTSPVGFGQGSFHVIPGSDGRRMVVNERNNQGLFSGIDIQHYPLTTTPEHTVTSASIPTDGPLEYKAFVELLGILAAEHGENQKAKAPLK